MIPGTQAPPAATRVARSGWRDPRLWIGVLLVAVSIVAGARLLAAADDTVAVWAVTAEQGPGSTVGSDQVSATRVRFADDADLERYFPASEPLPSDLVLLRGVGEGELLARSAVGPEEDLGLHQVSLEVAPQHSPPSVGVGDVVDVFVDDAAHPRVGDADGAVRALAAVTVVDAPPAEESFAVTGMRQLVVAVPADDVEAFQALLGGLDDPVVDVVRLP